MRILLVEDDLELCELITFALNKEGHKVDACYEGDDGLRWLKEQAHDLVLLDRMLPRLDGITLLRRAREAGITTPVLIMTALGSIDDRIEGLDVGADDYIVKPIAVGELLARIRAIARRPRSLEINAEASFGDLRLDTLKKTLYHAGRSVSLSRKETDLLELFIRNPCKIIPRAVIFARVWGPDAGVEEGNLDNYMYFVRQRLQSVESPLEIKTYRSSGFCLQERDSHASI